MSHLTVISEMDLWLHWGLVAIRAEADAWAQRKRFEGGAFDGLGHELQNALVATTASAFAIEALANQVWTRCREARVGDTGQDPKEPGGDRAARNLEILKLGFGVGSYQHRWVCWFGWLFGELRNRAVHYESENRETAPHPSGLTNADPEHNVFSAEAATQAVDLYLEVLTACFANPKPEIKGRYLVGTVDSLVEYRAKRVP